MTSLSLSISIVSAVFLLPSTSLQVGDELSFTLGDVDDMATPASMSVQWTRDGANISGATRTRYTLVTADAGTIPGVRVTLPGGIVLTASGTLVQAAAGGGGTAPAFTSASGWSIAEHPTAGVGFAAVPGAMTGSPTPTPAISALLVDGASAMTHVSGLNVNLPTSYRDAAVVTGGVVTATNGVNPAATSALPSPRYLFKRTQSLLTLSGLRGLTYMGGSPFPKSRRKDWYGDSRVNGVTSGRMAVQVMTRMGHKIAGIFDASHWNFAVGGSQVSGITAQIAAMQAANGDAIGCIAGVMSGTNGAGGGNPNTGAGLIAAMTARLAELQAAGYAHILLSNEMPGGNVGGKDEFYLYHVWLDTVAASLATTSTITIVDTWNACGDPRYLTDPLLHALHPMWINDQIHLGNAGEEVAAAAFCAAIDALFPTTCVDLNAAPATNLLNGATTTQRGDGAYNAGTDTFTGTNGGLVPGSGATAWNHYGGNTGLFFRTIGTGVNTTLELRNVTGAKIEQRLKGPGGWTATDGVAVLSYRYADYKGLAFPMDADRDQGVKLFLGAVTYNSNINPPETAATAPGGGQLMRQGGQFVQSHRFGASTGTTTIDLYVTVPANASVFLDFFGIYER